MKLLSNFISGNSAKTIFFVILEEYIGPLMRILPGYEGMVIRWLFCKVTFKKIGSLSHIFSGAFISHAYNITAGDCLAIQRGAYVDGRGGIDFGDYVLIGPYAYIGSSDHVVDCTDKPRVMLGNSPKPTRIGSNVWIGANVFIRPGVTIGDHSVIGAGSVVIDDIPPKVLAVGNPAKCIRDIK